MTVEYRIMSERSVDVPTTDSWLRLAGTPVKPWRTLVQGRFTIVERFLHRPDANA